jgi:hypothetical protein
VRGGGPGPRLGPGALANPPLAPARPQVCRSLQEAIRARAVGAGGAAEAAEAGLEEVLAVARLFTDAPAPG